MTSSAPMRVGYSRKAVLRFMRTSIVVTRGAVTIYTGKCSYRAAEANQGQLSEPDEIEADVSSYESYDVWIRYRDELLGDIREGDLCTINDSLVLTITAVEEDASDKVAIQLRAVKQRTATEIMMLTLIRVDPVTGSETVIAAQEAQIVLEGSAPISAGQEITGGSVNYLQGFIIFPNRNANVKAGDRFKHRGRWGEVTGVPTVANDRKEARMRIAGGGFD
jgi:hypothetical protein